MLNHKGKPTPLKSDVNSTFHLPMAVAVAAYRPSGATQCFHSFQLVWCLHKMHSLPGRILPYLCWPEPNWRHTCTHTDTRVRAHARARWWLQSGQCCFRASPQGFLHWLTLSPHLWTNRGASSKTTGQGRGVSIGSDGKGSDGKGSDGKGSDGKVPILETVLWWTNIDQNSKDGWNRRQQLNREQWINYINDTMPMRMTWRKKEHRKTADQKIQKFREQVKMTKKGGEKHAVIPDGLKPRLFLVHTLSPSPDNSCWRCTSPLTLQTDD